MFSMFLTGLACIAGGGLMFFDAAITADNYTMIITSVLVTQTVVTITSILTKQKE